MLYNLYRKLACYQNDFVLDDKLYKQTELYYQQSNKTKDNQ
ncbi:hypothetical protein yruck0001_31770 [Yersinia ruckeri ATCC 29473]|nr:hypothetical protein yruck0001_31770 [Yersinia ruckeri ATCC 29473]